MWEIVSGAREQQTWYAADVTEAFEGLSEGDFSDFEEIADSDGVENNPPAQTPELQTESNQLYLIVIETITSLFRLSIFIRKSTRGSKFAKSSAEKNYETLPDILHVRDRFPFAASNPTLVERLGKANAQRRQWLSYKQRHRNKLGTLGATEEPTGSQYLHSTPESVKQSKDKHLEGHAGASTTSRGIRSAITALSSTEASSFYEQSRECRENEENSEAEVSETTYNESQRSVSEQGMTYVPQPPRESENENPFECPYCFTILTISSRTQWT